MIEIFGRAGCVWCSRATKLASDHDVKFVYRDFTNDPSVLNELIDRIPNVATVPQIFADGKHIGGFEDFKAAIMRGDIKNG
jgi:glutaredoxin 3